MRKPTSSLRFKLWELRTSGAAFIALLLLLFMFAMFVLGWWTDKVGQEHGVMTTAVITGIGQTNSQYEPNRVFVSFQDRDGLTGGGSVDQVDIRGCKVGSKVQAELVGSDLRLMVAPCR